MPASNLESKRTVVTTGTHAQTPATPDKLRAIAASRPFTQQVDVVFPSCAALEDVLLKLDAVYWRCECALSDFLEFAKAHVHETALDSKVVALGLASTTNKDVWSLDSRGFLTLVVGKQTYEALGLIGEPLPWKELTDTHVIHISLRGSRPSVESMKTWLAYGPKEAAALRRWDAQRGPWKVLFYCDGIESSMIGSTRCELSRTVHRRENVHVPEIRRDDILTHGGQRDGVADEWEQHVPSLFEWIGMASLGSPRISANDRCDPYIAVYTPPEPSRVSDVTAIRWSGLIPPTFVQSIVDSVTSPNVPSPGFVAVTAQCIPTAPVSYLPVDPTKAPPLRAPRSEAEDTWSAVYVKDDVGAWWALAESVGQWDKRWG